MKTIFNKTNELRVRSIYVAGLIIILLLVPSLMLITAAQNPVSQDTNSRTGNLENQPTTGYFEGNDIFEIYHLDDTHDTEFSIGEIVYVRLTTNRVQDTVNKNVLEVRSYTDNKIIDQDPAFTQVSFSSPYVYEANFTAPSPADHYLVEVELEDDIGNIFRTFDVIIVDGGSSPMKYIKTYSDPDYNILQNTFCSNDIIYIEVYQNADPNPQNSKIEFSDYQDNNDNINIRDLQNSTLNWYLNNYARIALDLENDIKMTLQDSYWYSITTDIRNDQGTDICRKWSSQIYIKHPPEVSSGITSTNSPVDVVGANQVTISAQFTNPEVLAISSFQTSFKLRGPDDSSEISLVDQKTHGSAGELGGTISIVLDTQTNIYTASYSFDPTESWTLGDYDLYFSVSNQYGQIIDGYNNNNNELKLFNANIQPPQITLGITKCIPSSVDIFGNGTVTIYSEFTDIGNPEISSFIVSFKIKQQANAAIDLVKDKINGGTGEFGGTVSISFSGGIYTVSYTWDPDPTFNSGNYHLFFEVDDGISGKTQDDFDNNQNELTIINSDSIPEINIGTTTVLPSSLDKIGEGSVTIYSEFSDVDLPELATFLVTFKVRDENKNEIVLVDAKSDGALSEFGNIVTVEFSGTIYTASVTWDPDKFVLTGLYDLYFQVEDGNGNMAEDGFGANREELEIISSINPPKIDETTTIPSSVNKIGSGTTTIYTTFTDGKYSDILNFTVTFKLRAPDDSIFNLTINTGHNEIGEYSSKLSITYSGTIFTASYQWNPPDSVPIGKYDLYCLIKNEGGGIAIDDFNDNLNELQIETTENPPEISNTQCIPSSVSVLADANTQLFVIFTDIGTPPIEDFSITFKVRDENNNEIILVEDKSNSLPGTFNELLSVSFSGTEYTASIFWDPSEDAYSGMYDLYSSVKDKNGTLIEHGFDKNKNELTLTDGPAVGSPILDGTYTLEQGSNVYNFTATYTDGDNDTPNEDGVIISIDGKNYQMNESDPNDQDHSDGKEYYYSLVLPNGDHTYSFKVTNEDNELEETGESSLSVGPDVKDKGSSSEESNMALFIILIIAIIVVILVLLLIVKKRSRPPQMKRPSERELGEKPLEPEYEHRTEHGPELEHGTAGDTPVVRSVESEKL